MVALKGSLKEQSTADLLMYFADEHLTGVLRFKNKKREVHMDFMRGKVVHVSEKPNSLSGTLGEMLLHIGEITEAELEQAIAQQKRSLSPLGVVLQNLFNCEPERIRFVLRVQAIEAIYTLFFWRSGTYEFEQTNVSTPRNNYDPIELPHLVAEGVPVTEAWPTIQKYFPEPLVSVRRLMPQISDALYERLDELPCAIFELLDQESTFRELSILSGAGKFATGYALVQLLQVELIRIEAPKKKDSVDIPKLLFGRSIGHFLVWMIVSALLVCGGTFLFAFAPYSPVRLWRSPSQLTIPDSRWNDDVDKWRKARIQRALALYQMAKGRYPASLEQLAKEGWIANSVIYYPGGNVYDYQRISGGRYRLLTPLP